MLYIYAILLAPFQLSDTIIGLSNQPVQCFVAGQLVAIAEQGVDVSALRQLPESDLLEKVLRHDQVITSLFRDRPLLPMRFGIAFVSESALYQYLQENVQQLSDRLQFLAGKAEYTLELTPPMPPRETISTASGKSYLLAKKQQYAQQKNWSDRIRQESLLWCDRLNQYCTKWQIPYQIATISDTGVKCHLLLTSEQYIALSESLEQTVKSQPVAGSFWQWQISDPLPAYHFV
jgi:hypothetical protein